MWERESPREAFEEANAVGEVDTVVYNAYIDVCAGRGDYEGALETLERMKKTPDVAPNIRSYNGVISASTRQKNFTGAVAAWEEIKRAKDLEPTKITYGAMLAAGAAADDVDVEWSEQLFDEVPRSYESMWLWFDTIYHPCVVPLNNPHSYKDSITVSFDLLVYCVDLYSSSRCNDPGI